MPTAEQASIEKPQFEQFLEKLGAAAAAQKIGPAPKASALQMPPQEGGMTMAEPEQVAMMLEKHPLLQQFFTELEQSKQPAQYVKDTLRAAGAELLSVGAVYCLPVWQLFRAKICQDVVFSCVFHAFSLSNRCETGAPEVAEDHPQLREAMKTHPKLAELVQERVDAAKVWAKAEKDGEVTPPVPPPPVSPLGHLAVMIQDQFPWPGTVV